MKIRNWKQYFCPHILGRGEEYYYDGAVEDLRETEPGKERFAVLMKEWPQMYPTRKSLVKTLNEVNDKLKPRSV